MGHLVVCVLAFTINPWPNDQILDLTKLNTFSDDKSNFAKITISLW